MSEAIPHETLIYVRAAVRFQVLWQMNRVMAESGATCQRTASRLNCSERHVRRVLSGKTDLSLREIGEILWAIDGLTIQPNLVPRATVRASE
jgi:hypothetical protein